MSYTPDEMRQIEGGEGLRWPVIPEGCPPEIRSLIVDERARRLGFYKDPEAEAVRERLDVAKSVSVSQ